MASALFLIFLLISLSSLPHSLPSTVRPSRNRFRSELISNSIHTPLSPTTYFEVTKPIKLPKAEPCSYLILQHQFGYTYEKPPVLANYSPPSNCASQNFAKIVLEWVATSKGRQFDRIFGVWLGGVEILRSCTAEPRATGIIWTVKKDITRYHSLLMRNQTLAVYLGNLVDKTFTGVYNVNLTLHFYPAEEHHKSKTNSDNSINGYDSKADIILPISRNLPLKDGLWFEVENSTDIQTKEFKIPQNVYKAVLEVYVSFHENDEFWYGNLPNEYIEANNLTAVLGNGPFREVMVTIDGVLVGAVWPFTVIYTGGVNPLLWRPITGIGSFDLPSYDIELTPFLETLLDSKNHEIGFSVTNALNVWYIDANLHLWVDEKSEKTRAKLLSHNSLPLSFSSVCNFNGLNGTFTTSVTRSINSYGWVKSSNGKITTRSNQEFGYKNSMVMDKNGVLQIINQTIRLKNRVDTKTPSTYIHSMKSFKNFPLYLYTDSVDQENGTYSAISRITMGFSEKNVESFSDTGISISSLKNLQSGEGSMLVKGNLVVSGLGSTKQELFAYDDMKNCYFRNVSSSNYTILYDEQGETCGREARSRFNPGRRTFLGSNPHGK